LPLAIATLLGMDTTPATSLSDEDRWQAVQRRDRRFDGSFVYAVRSTGIFCRPSCPSRRPARGTLRFFEVPEAAIAAGFRPCLRCRPQAQTASDPNLAIVRKVCALIEAGDEQQPTLAALGREVGLSRFHLQRRFKAAMGISPKQYAEAVRLGRVKRELRDGDSVAAALYGAGYGSSSRLYEKAPSRLGMTPASYAKGGAGARIRYAIIPCPPLGLVLVAATDRGICMVAMGMIESELGAALHEEYPAADIRRDDQGLAERARQVALLAEGRSPPTELPLDVRATAFQAMVWERLTRIPRGSTRTYGEIAADLGKPGSARAVGRACAMNPVALVVPCHRAVGSGGQLHGYRWGVRRKQAILARERENR
jgi:AraC family transcriptional regulator of adaptative response/methylated-DNA-[protein]-cysteine methyltransferase